MKKAKRFGQYQCNHRRTVRMPSKDSYDKGSKSTVSGRYCKNNCSLYQTKKCTHFKPHGDINE